MIGETGAGCNSFNYFVNKTILCLNLKQIKHQYTAHKSTLCNVEVLTMLSQPLKEKYAFSTCSCGVTTYPALGLVVTQPGVGCNNVPIGL